MRLCQSCMFVKVESASTSLCVCQRGFQRELGEAEVIPYGWVTFHPLPVRETVMWSLGSHLQPSENEGAGSSPVGSWYFQGMVCITCFGHCTGTGCISIWLCPSFFIVSKGAHTTFRQKNRTVYCSADWLPWVHWLCCLNSLGNMKFPCRVFLI